MDNNPKPRVVLLYRASSKKQTDSENDIPLQRNILRPWVEQQGWEFVKEFVEGGISGFKISAEKRDAIQEIKRMAERKEFDILGVYMSDRLGRISQETPLIIGFLNSKQIRVMSYREGEISSHNHADKLMTYIRYWQAEGESLKTSARVRDAHEQMVKSGKLLGGSMPYGYKTVSKGTLNFKGRPVFDVEIDQEQAEIVKLIYKLYTQENYGAKGIARVLNNRGILSYKGCLWQHSTVMNILKNRLYTGVYVMDKRRKDKPNIYSPIMPQYVIIEQADYDKAQEIIAKQLAEFRPNGTQRITAHGSQILTGLLRCGECGKKFTGYRREGKHKMKHTGEDKYYKKAYYRCNSFRYPIERKETCHQTIYDQQVLDYLVVKDAKEFLLETDKDTMLNSHTDQTKEKIKEAEVRLSKTESDLSKKETEVTRLKDEIMKALLGQSAISLETLNEMLKTKEQEKLDANQNHIDAQNTAIDLDHQLNMQIEISDTLKSWASQFDSQSHAVKKTMLLNIIEKIVAENNQIEIHYKLGLSPLNNLTPLDVDQVNLNNQSHDHNSQNNPTQNQATGATVCHDYNNSNQTTHGNSSQALATNVAQIDTHIANQSPQTQLSLQNITKTPISHTQNCVQGVAPSKLL